MKKLIFLLFLLFTTIIVYPAEKKPPHSLTKGFVENIGQVIDQNKIPNPKVLYLLNLPGMNVQLRSLGWSYDLYEMDTVDNQPFAVRHSPLAPIDVNNPKSEKRKANSCLYHRIDFDLINSNPNCEIITTEPLAGRNHYYTTGTSVEGVTNVRSYQAITFKNIYPEIDLEFVSDEEHGFKYNFIIHPGGKLSSIQIRITEPDIELTSAGSLRMSTSLGTMEETIPFSYYTIHDEKEPIGAVYTKLADRIYGFETDRKISADASLIIDPLPDRVWGTYYGGGDGDYAFASTVDDQMNCYIAGRTQSVAAIATSGSHQGIIGGLTDGYIAKFTPSGLRIWATYYGGGNNDIIMGLAMAADMKLIATGNTASGQNISTPGAFQEAIGSVNVNDAFLVKFDTSGLRLWGTYYGGIAEDGGFGCAVDDDGNIYMSGDTRSLTGIATIGSHQSVFGGGTGSDLFLVKFTPQGNRVWGTYYGGDCSDEPGVVNNCTTDGNAAVYICGSTCSANNIASAGAYQPTLSGTNSADGLLVRFDTSGIRQWGTYYGGPGDDRISLVKVVKDHRIMLGGETQSSTGIATSGAFKISLTGSGDAFLGRFYQNGQPHWVSYYGGTDFEAIYSGDSDPSGNLYYCGYSSSMTGISTLGTFQPTFGGGFCDEILVKFDSTGNRMWGTYHGSEGTEYAYSCNYVNQNLIYLAGGTTSLTNVVTSGTQQTIYGGGIWDALLVRLTECTAPIISIIGNTSVYQGSINTYITQAGNSSYTWSYSPGGSLVSGGASTDNTITFQWNTVGAQWVQVNYTNADGCTALSPFQLDVTVLPSPLTVGFIAPDTVCVNETINIANTTTGGSTYYWNFCSGNANNDPTGLNIGNPGSLLDIPTYITLVKENNDCYSFISCQQTGVVRYYHGGSFKNNPISWTNIGKLGIIDFDQEGIQVKYDNGQWYGFVNSDTTVIRLDFGTSLANMPTAVNLNISHVFWMAHGLSIIKEGNTWLGFLTCSLENKIFRLNFGSSLSNLSPTLQDFGNPAGLISPGPICIVEENGSWYLMITAGGNTLSRMDFGNSLLNTPTGVNLGNPGGFNNQIALTILRDCEATYGYYCNYIVNGQLGKLTFPSGVSGPVTGQLLGNIGNLNRPAMFSEIFRSNDTLYAYITNRGNGTLTRLTFPPCTNASVGSSTLFTPPPFSYNTPGTYNIRLIVDEGSPTQGTLCKSIEVMDPPVVNLGTDLMKCPSTSILLDAGTGFDTYLWSTGATTQSFWTTMPGTYWVVATRWGCSSTDTIVIGNHPVPLVNLGPDSTICIGIPVTFDAGLCVGCSYSWDNVTAGLLNIGNGQTYTATTAGVYKVTVTNSFFCWASDVVELFYTPLATVSVNVTASANPVCPGILVAFQANGTNAGTYPTYQWKVNGANVGGNSSSYSYIPTNGDLVTCILTSSETCTLNNPATSLPIQMSINPTIPLSVAISASSNPFCLGSQVTFTATPISGLINKTFHWNVNGIAVGTNSPTYSYAPSAGDLVQCQLESTDPCITGSPAVSNTVIMTVNTSFPAGVSISVSKNPFCPGSSVTFTATPTNGGTFPSYQWKRNGVNAGSNSSTFTVNPNGGDSIRCIMTSNLACVTQNPASSNSIVMGTLPAPAVTFVPCFDTITTTNAKPIKLKGGIPLGGTYTGPAVSNGYFYPNLAGVGTKTITYSYTNTALCAASALTRIHQSTDSPFSCGNNLTDIRDGKIYPTVKIGSQCWMATNLNFGLQTSDLIHQRDNCLNEKYCFQNLSANCEQRGANYQWDELMRYDDTPGLQGLCPPAWHVPTEAEWTTLFANWTNSGFAGSPLKYSGYSGFNALLGGVNAQNRGWYYDDFATFFWTSSSYTDIKAWSHAMNDFDPSVSLYPSLKSNAFSVRCVKD